MGRIAHRIFTKSEDIDRIRGFVRELAINARVRLHLLEGEPVEGIVMVTPTVQEFRNENDDEGLNGVVKLEDPQQPGWSGLVWLGDIDRVEHLDSVTMDSTRA
jgi:uncharacterized protein DUF3247